MKTFIQLAAASGHTFEIPVAVVANHRAATMLKLHPDEFDTLESAMVDTIELFKDSLYDIKDWATNNMNWTDIEPNARLIRFTPPEFDFVNDGEWTFHEHRAITGELDAATVMQSPVELVVTTMAEASQICGITVLNNADGEAFGAIAVITGGPGVVSAFIAALSHTVEQIAPGATQAQAH